MWIGNREVGVPCCNGGVKTHRGFNVCDVVVDGGVGVLDGHGVIA